MIENRFYVYLHRRKTDGTIFYVGKGTAKRVTTSEGRNDYWNNIALKHGVISEILIENLTEEEALQAEIDVIKELKYFGHTLCNLTAGGEGVSNPALSTRLKMSLAKKGKTPHNKGKTQCSTAKVNNPSSDKNIYTFVKYNLLFTGTRYDLCEHYNIPIDKLGKLFYKLARKRVRGWSLQEKNNGGN